MVGKSYMQEFGETYHTHSVLTDRCLSEIDLVFFRDNLHVHFTCEFLCNFYSLWDPNYRPRTSFSTSVQRPYEFVGSNDI
jgi:hypothetical protein